MSRKGASTTMGGVRHRRNRQGIARSGSMESVSERHVCLRPWQWSRRKSFIIIIIIISPSGVCLWQEIVLHRVSKTSLSPRFNPNPAYACRGMLVACVWPHPSWLLRTRVVLVRASKRRAGCSRGNLTTGFVGSCCTNRHYWLGIWTSRMQTSAYRERPT